MTPPPLLMVVDDDRDIRETLVEALEDQGYRAIGAANGREALDALAARDERPALILLDLMMPVMDGRAFRDVQRDHPRWSAIPVIVISAYSDVDAQALGVECLRKPLAMRTLLAAIARALAPHEVDRVR